MKIIQQLNQGGYEQLLFCVDPKTGLNAFIAIHDTTLGPALGGCRIWPHATENEAIFDVLRLAKAMTYKNSAAGLNYGGGKALIWADSNSKNEGMLRSFGRYVDSLGGRYITTEDVGSSLEDMISIRQSTYNVVGLPESSGGSGDPSKATGFGIWKGMKACIQEVFGTQSFDGMRIVIQGFGKVATYLSEHLLREKAKLIVSDVNEIALKRASDIGCSIITNPDGIYDVPCEIFSPCALGGTLNSITIGRLTCKIVAGSANNQLLEEADGELFQQRNILYAPDYVINAGGVINLSFERPGPYSEENALDRVSNIFQSIENVISISKHEGISTNRAAARIAENRIASVRNIKPSFETKTH